MEPYITFRDTDKNGELQYYVLQGVFPHFVGIVLNHPKEGAIAEASVLNYHIYISFGGTIQGNYILSKKDINKELQQTMQSMADWFYKSRILVEPKRFKKWAIAKK